VAVNTNVGVVLEVQQFIFVDRQQMTNQLKSVTQNVLKGGFGLIGCYVDIELHGVTSKKTAIMKIKAQLETLSVRLSVSA
jgi:hypothetical protein